MNWTIVRLLTAKAQPKRTRPEACGPGFKVSRRPSIDDYDKR